MNRGAGRIGIIIVLIVSLALAGATRDWAEHLRRSNNDQFTDDASASSLANMNSFALALLLGGLRGPLVMVLWTQSESLKNERNLEDFDTYVEWIRLLQPEFDTVHIFQVWNKAYNISVQMASLSNKYITILDAIDYARRVLAERPNDINMIYGIASIYFDKLGNSAEKSYYKQRVRSESLPHPSKQRLAKNDPGWRRLELDPMLDVHGNILPELLKPKYSRPANIAADSDWNDGSELQYLKQYQPLPYGLSTFALAYNYHKQAQVLQTVAHLHHANLSELVVDSRPALALKGWSEDEWELARRIELKAFNITAPAGDERGPLELPTADLAPDTPFSDRAAIEQAIFSYDLAARVSGDAIKEYERHLRNYTTNFTTYQSHLDSMRSQRPLLEADRDYLKAMLAPAGEARQKLLAAAAKEYRDAAGLNLDIIMHYYMSDDIATRLLPKGVTRSETGKLSIEDKLKIFFTMKAIIAQRGFDADAEDRGEYERYIQRCDERVKRIEGKAITSALMPATTRAAATAPTH